MEEVRNSKGSVVGHIRSASIGNTEVVTLSGNSVGTVRLDGTYDEYGNKISNIRDVGMLLPKLYEDYARSHATMSW